MATSPGKGSAPGNRGVPVVKDSARYVKLIEWSDEDWCFVGQCPGIIGPCCHGDDESAVYAELCQIVDEWVETMNRRGEPLPPAVLRARRGTRPGGQRGVRRP